MKQLLILRHAKSDWGDSDLADFDRPLNERGKKAATQMGQWMRNSEMIPDYILSSPALRARQTIELVSQEISFDDKNIHWDKRMYLASPKALIEMVTSIPSTVNQALIVGHNPGLEELLFYLCDGDIPRSHNGKIMATATLAQIELAKDFDQIGAQQAKLLNLYWPKQLPSF